MNNNNNNNILLILRIFGKMIYKKIINKGTKKNLL